MTFTDLTNILHSSSLDRGTKLAIMDLVASTENEELLNDTLELVRLWHESDELAKNQLKEALKEIERQYETEVHQAHNAAQQQFRVLSKEIKKTEDMEKAKEAITYHFEEK